MRSPPSGGHLVSTACVSWAGTATRGASRQSLGRSHSIPPNPHHSVSKSPRDAFLALEGSRMTSDDIAAMQSFLDQLRFARERALLGAIEETGEKGDEASPQ